MIWIQFFNFYSTCIYIYSSIFDIILQKSYKKFIKIQSPILIPPLNYPRNNNINSFNLNLFPQNYNLYNSYHHPFFKQFLQTVPNFFFFNLISSTSTRNIYNDIQLVILKFESIGPHNFALRITLEITQAPRKDRGGFH